MKALGRADRAVWGDCLRSAQRNLQPNRLQYQETMPAPEPHADEWDAGAMGCGELLMLLSPRIKALRPGEILRLIARDPGAVEDMPAWCRLTGHHLVYANHPEYLIRRREN